jgi:hypothetical protein
MDKMDGRLIRAMEDGWMMNGGCQSGLSALRELVIV